MSRGAKLYWSLMMMFWAFLAIAGAFAAERNEWVLLIVVGGIFFSFGAQLISYTIFPEKKK